jgi:hypothetical protein
MWIDRLTDHKLGSPFLNHVVPLPTRCSDLSQKVQMGVGVLMIIQLDVGNLIDDEADILL